MPPYIQLVCQCTAACWLGVGFFRFIYKMTKEEGGSIDPGLAVFVVIVAMAVTAIKAAVLYGAGCFCCFGH